MLIQLIFQIAIICAAVIVACFAYLSAFAVKSGCSGMPAYLYAYISETLPLNSFLTVVLQMAFVLIGCKAIFSYISNHIIISLDILYIESLLLIFFCHTMKGYRGPLSESLV